MSRHYLGGGKIETVIWTPSGRLIKKTSYIANHTEKTELEWKHKRANQT